MTIEKGNKVLCVENNSTVRPLVIESIDGHKILFSKQLSKGVKKTFSLKKGSFQLIKPRYISEHEKKDYINPKLEMNDKVKVIHVEGTWNDTNLLGRDGIVISIKENERGDREIMLYMEDTQEMANLELEYRMLSDEIYKSFVNPPKGELIQKSLVLKLDEPKAKQEDYIDGLLHIPEQTEEKKQEVSPDLEAGDRIMAWDISPENLPPGLYDKSTPSTFIATVIEVLDIYDPADENGIKYLVKIEDTDEVVGLYGGEWLGGSIHPIRDKYHKDTRDKWLKLPKIGITEDSDIFGQGLLDPIEPEEFEGSEKDWDELIDDVEDDNFEVEPEYSYKGGKTDPETGFVAPSAEVTDNICKVKGFCDAQGPITFGQLKALVEEATKKRIGADIGRGVFKSLWRIVPFFIPQVLLASVGVTVTRAFNKVITPALKDTQGYKSWWGKVVLKAMDIAEGDYIPDVALGDDPLSKIFFISDGLLQMIRDKYKLKFARYVADVATTQPDNEPVPEWFVENLLRDYLNQKFLLDPPLPIKQTQNELEGIELHEHDDDRDPEDGIQTREPFTRTEAQILNYLSKEFTWEELNTISSVDEMQVPGDIERKWNNTLKLFGQPPKGSEEAWIRSSRWAKWAVENWSEACSGKDSGEGLTVCDFKDVTTPIKSWPSWFTVDADESYWQKEYRNGTIELGAYDREDAEERAEMSWWDYEPDMDHYDYGDTDEHELNITDVHYDKPLNEQKDVRNMEGFTPKLIGYLKFVFETNEILTDYDLIRADLFDISEWEVKTLYLTLMYNLNEVSSDRTIKDMLNNMPIEDYVIPEVWEYDFQYYDGYEQGQDEEECDNDGYGEITGEDCECEVGVKYVEDKDGYEQEEDCDFGEDDDCECQEFWRKEYDIYYNNDCTKTIYSTTKLEKTHEGSDEAYGYETMYDVNNELNDGNSVIEQEGCEPDYDDGNTWEYFQERDDEIIGVDTNKWPSSAVPNLLEQINNKIYGVKRIEEQYEMVSPKEMKIRDLTSQIFQTLDDEFSIRPHPAGDIDNMGDPVSLYSNTMEMFVPVEDIYNPIMQMIEGGIQQEDIDVFVEIISTWINYNMSTPQEMVNEDVKINDDSGNYTKEDFYPFIDFVINELGIETPIDVIIQSDIPDGTTAKYTMEPKDKIKVTIKNDGRKLVDMFRSIAHELVHHKQNEVGKVDYYSEKLGGIPNIGGEIEDEANAIAGQLIKKYAELQPGIYNESKSFLLKEIIPLDPSTSSSLGTTMIFPIDSDNFNIGYDVQGLGSDVDPKVLDANKALHRCRWRGYSHHEGGIDIFGPEGEPMVSPADGVVTHITTEDVGSPGKSIHIQRPDGITFVLMHLHWIRNLKIGDHISAGEEVGSLGRTGNAKGTHPHLHFSIYDATGYGDNIWRAYRKGNVNPCPYIKSSLGQYTIENHNKLKNILAEEKVVGFNSPSNNFVVIAGGPGAGKSFITKNLINLDNVKDFNVDQVRIMTAKKLWGKEWEEKISTEEGYQKILDMTHTTSDPRNLTVKFLKHFLTQERNHSVNVVYDAGGGQEQVMKDVHDIAHNAGFNTTLVYVRTPLELAQQRNLARPRSLPNDMVAQYHQKVKDNMRNLIPLFDSVWTVDNKELIDLSDRPSENIEKIK